MLSARISRKPCRLCRSRLHRLPAAVSKEKACRCRRRLLRRHLLSVRRDGQVFAGAKKFDLPIKLHANSFPIWAAPGSPAAMAPFPSIISNIWMRWALPHCPVGNRRLSCCPGPSILREKQHPPVAALRTHKVPIAIGDRSQSRLLARPFPAHHHEHGLRPLWPQPEEALRGVTVNAARALGFKDRGEIATGMKADFVLWNIEASGRSLLSLGFKPVRRRDQEWRHRQGQALMTAPLYAKVKAHILGHIRSGAWTPACACRPRTSWSAFQHFTHDCNRALRELTADGFLSRVPGVGTFVREPPPARSSLVRNCATSPRRIAARGHRHAATSSGARRSRPPPR